MQKVQARVDQQLEQRRVMLVVSGCMERTKEQKQTRCCSAGKKRHQMERWQATCIRNETWRAERIEMGWIPEIVCVKGVGHLVLKHRWNGLCPTFPDHHLPLAPWVGQRQQWVVG